MRKQEPKLSVQCKICRLLKLSPDTQTLYTQIHKMVLQERISQAEVMRWANRQIDILNMSREEKLDHLTVMNFSKHFRSHMTELDRMNVQVKNTVLGKEYSTSGFGEVEKAIAASFLNDYTAEMADYKSMSIMVDQLEERLRLYSENAGVKTAADGKVRINISELKDFQLLLRELLAMKVDLSKFRNSAKVSGQAVRFAVETSISAFLNQMFIITDEIFSLLSAELPNSSLPNEVVKMIKSRVGEGMKTIFPEIIDKAFTEFRIK